MNEENKMQAYKSDLIMVEGMITEYENLLKDIESGVYADSIKKLIESKEVYRQHLIKLINN
jgi:hypothetical protein